MPAQIESWLQAVNHLKPDAGIPGGDCPAHCRFEQIHPFLDGNGRTGRLVLNLILVRFGYPPAIIYKGQRLKYLRALRRADEDDPGALGELLARAILDNLYKFIVPAVAGPARLVPLAASPARRQPRRSASRGDKGPPPGHQGTRRPVAQFPQLGGSVPRYEASPRLRVYLAGSTPRVPLCHPPVAALRPITPRYHRR